MIYGLTDALLFLVPNPKDQVGYALEEPWPWTALLEPLY